MLIAHSFGRVRKEELSSSDTFLVRMWYSESTCGYRRLAYVTGMGRGSVLIS